uniref:hypothetical protein n=1 Tax=Thaumasiovibrio occultus TaxID=1891184 RepID=UPI000B353E5E|nr:hypothetical protein [Thaumasiovibrio occultus]
MNATNLTDSEFLAIRSTLEQYLSTQWVVESSPQFNVQVNKLDRSRQQAFVDALNRDLAGHATCDTLFSLPEYWLNEDTVGPRSYTLDADITLTHNDECCGLMKISLSFWRTKGHWYCSIDLNLITVLSSYREQGVGKLLVEQGIDHYVNRLIIDGFSRLEKRDVQLDLVFQADYLNQASKKLGEYAFELLESIDIELSARSYLVDMSNE